MNNILLDLRSALRGLRRTPGFTALALLLVALSVGANTLVLTWLRAVVVEPLPGVRNVHEFVHLSAVYGERSGVSLLPSDLEMLQKNARTLRGIIAHELQEVALDPGDAGAPSAPISINEPEQLMSGIVSGNYFAALGVPAALGRTLQISDDRPEAPPVLVLSEALWRRRFAADPAVVGRTVQVDRQAFTVVGVAPRDFGGTYGGLLQAFWMPLSAMSHIAPGQRVYVQIMGRLAPGAAIADVRAELPVLAARLRDADPQAHKGLGLSVSPLLDSPRGVLSGFVPMITVLAVTAALLLVLAWSNLANLLLARGLARRRDLAVRRALGAGRFDLLRWAAGEGLLISLLGGAAGLWLANAASPFLLAMLPIGIPLAFKVGLDPWACAGAAGLTLFAAALFAVVAAVGERRMDLATVLKSEGAGALGGRGKKRLRAVLVAVQCGLAMLAITGALLMARSAGAAARADVGFARDGALLATLNPALGGYDTARTRVLLRTLLERAAALPGVRSASATTYVPMGGSGGGNSQRAEIEGYSPRADELLNIVSDGVGPAYLQAMGMRLLAGREFAGSDQDGAPRVAVVNAAFSRRYYGDDRAALGRRVKLSGNWHDVVGIVQDFTYRRLGGPAEPTLFVPMLQNEPRGFTLVVRTAGDPAALAPALRGAIRQLDAGLAVSGLETLRQHAAQMSDIQQVLARLLGACGGLALLLAALGLYAVVAHSVGERRREIGMRMALGASAQGVLRMVLAEGLRAAAIGAGVGLLLGFAVAQLLRGLIFGVAAADPVTFGGAALLLAVTAILASVVPALAASRLEPLQALRYE